GYDLEIAGDGSNLDRHLQWVGHQQDVDQVVFGDGDTPIAEAIDKLRLGDHVRIKPVAAIPCVRVIGGMEVIEFHRQNPSRAGSVSRGACCQKIACLKNEYFRRLCSEIPNY